MASDVPVDATPNEADADLLAAHVAGDADAFGLLFARHRDRLWAVALRTCGNPEMAADGLQDALVAAFRRAGSFRGEAAVTTWLHRIVVNACLDRLRAARVRRAEPLPDEPGALEALAGRPTVTAAIDPERQAIEGERRARVLAALGSLTPEQRAAVVLVDMEGYSVAEVAAMLDCAEGTVKSRCSRGRARLAPLLADLMSAPGDAAAVDETKATSAIGPIGNPATAPDVGPLAPRGPPAPSGADPLTTD